ncbi:recombinase family protein [Sinorhizobium meliloti]|uniref:recombinase family protein n=1 Tax=Rhizobium meliloti TaxID=382 RepID=UPI0002FDDD65|nr:recombinase family protein [Sinorhizobium meliloti]MDE4555509.1 recombinase family protein [Sinorhizobium meliloti]
MTKPRAYSYVRMSTDAQLKGDSLRRQTEASKLYAEQNGYELIDDFKLEDIGVSAFNGRNVSQGALGRFLDAVQQARVPHGSYLLVESLDRISREPPQVATGLFLQILAAGVNIVTLTDGRVYRTASSDPTDLIFSVVIMSRAYEESLTKSLRVGAAWENKRKNLTSKKLTEVAPAWLALSSDRSSFDLIERNADTVRRIFDEADAGKGSYQIARGFNLEGLPPFTRSNGWHESYITKILTTRAVLGEFQPCKYINGKRVPHGESIEGYFPPIISREQFERVQLARKARKNRGSGRKGKSHVNLFSGVAKCGYCGSSMYVVDKGPKPKGGVYLRCDSARRGNGCKASAWPLAHFETAFLYFVRELDLAALLSAEKRQQELRQTEGALASKQADLEKQKRVREDAFALLATSSASYDFVGQKIDDATVAIGKIECEIGALKDLLAGYRTASVRVDFDIKSIIEKLLSESDAQFENRVKVADWIRTNVNSLRVYADGTDGPADRIAEMRGEVETALDPEALAIVDRITREARRKGALTSDFDRRFVVSFDHGGFRSVRIDRDDPTKHVTSIHYAEGEWSIDDRRL